jgi:hypothetical protein
MRGCRWCSNAGRVARLLDDGTGRLNPALQPLADMLLDAPNWKATGAYLSRSVAPLLTELATGRLPLTHEGLRHWPNARVAAHLRDLLMACQVLPTVDRVLLDIEAWLHRRLEALREHPHRRLLHQFAHWHQLPRLRATAAGGPLRPTARQYADHQFAAAQAFCTWLVDHDLHPDTLTQADLDRWYASCRLHQRQNVRGFLTWAITHRQLPPLTVPVVRYAPGPAITQQQRLTLLRRYLDDQTTPLATRAAVVLLLLFAQPLSRILRLTIDDLADDSNGGLLLQLGDPPSPVPEPFAGLLRQLADDREHAATPSWHAGRWLFPGRHPGQPMAYTTLHQRLQRLGFPLKQARISALRELVLQVPAPVIADALGFHQKSTARQVANAGGTWSRYPTGRRAGSPTSAAAEVPR